MPGCVGARAHLCVEHSLAIHNCAADDNYSGAGALIWLSQHIDDIFGKVLYRSENGVKPCTINIINLLNFNDSKATLILDTEMINVRARA